jgi:hypothetical protein
MGYWLDSFSGAGAALVPRLIAAMGTQRDRYQSATELQSYTPHIALDFSSEAFANQECVLAGFLHYVCSSRPFLVHLRRN